ncbi:MAG: sensor histidine kinase [Bryobacteraceae bacterium]
MSNPFSLQRDLTDGDLARLYRLQVREQTDFAMFAMSPEGQMATWNHGVEHMFGYSEQEWLGQDTGIIFLDEDNEDGVPQREMDAAKKQGRSSNIRWHKRKDGTRIYLRGVLNALYEEDGSFLGFSKTVVDDTARKNLEDALTQSNSDLQQFAFAASHDLQQPLRTISIYAELLGHRYRDKLDGEAEKLLGSMAEATERMSAMITDLLAYSQLALQEAEVTSVDLNEDWESAVSLLRSGIEQENATITHDPLPKVKLDRSQLVRLFQNLIANSIKFRKPGEAPRIHGWAERVDNEWIVRVKDNGIGFPPEHAAAIFTPFKRLHSTREYPGSGIGLAACKRIVEGWGGRIGAESKPGDGSTFWFTLPAS